MPALLARLIVLALGVSLFGCAEIPQQTKSPLLPPRMSHDSIALDIISVRLPRGDGQLAEDLWHELDEQHFRPKLRRLLQLNGFRAGIAGGHVPRALEPLVASSTEPDLDLTVSTTDVGNTPMILRRLLQLRAGHPSQIVASDVVGTFQVLYHDGHGVGGQTRQEAQAIFGLKAFPQGDGRVKIEMIPEVHYGQPKQRYVPGEGMWRMDFSRPKESFDDLRLEATLAPGDMLFLSSIPGLKGSLGHQFFDVTYDESVERKLLVIRLAQTQHNDLFGPVPEVPAEDAAAK